MSGDILRAAHQIEAQQAALAGLRAHYAGLAHMELLRAALAGRLAPEDRGEMQPSDVARIAVAHADALVAALTRPPAAH